MHSLCCSIRQLILGLSFLILPVFLSGQDNYIDSLERKLKLAVHDSSRWGILFNLSKAYYGYDTIKSELYQVRGYAIIKSLDDSCAWAGYYISKFDKAYATSQFPAALAYIDTAISLFKACIASSNSFEKIQYAKYAMASCNSDIGIVYNKQGKNEKAVTFFLEYIDIAKSSNLPEKNEGIASAYNNVASCYYDLNNFEKAVKYDKEALAYRILDKNEEMIAISNIFVADDLGNMKHFDSALIYLKKARPIVDKLRKNSLNVHYYDIVAQTHRLKGDFLTAIRYYKLTIEETKKINDKFQLMRCQKMLGICYSGMHDFNSARQAFLLALPAATENNSPKEKIEILQELVDLEEKANNTEVAFSYLKQLIVIKDSLQNDEVSKSISEIEQKYQAKENEKTILQLEKDKEIQSLSIRQKSILNYFLFASLAAFLIVGFLVYRNFRNRQQLAIQLDEIHQQRIRELEKDKLLVAVDSMLKGQEEERSRLAKELHDGLGGLLSGVKFSLSNMKGNLISTADNMAVFERALDMIDGSIRELRRVAHNMMPEILTKFGLDEALKEYCHIINNTQLLKVKYQALGLGHRPDKSTEIIVYRIVQELLNNIMKHAGATEAFVQLIRQDKRLNLVVEDNGRGFDPSFPENNTGTGWVNIRSRVDYLKGELDIHSEPGKGTLVNIEFKL